MEEPLLLPSVSLRELNRRPGYVLDHVRRGQRLVVKCHGKPIATIQPLDGFVIDPISGVQTDICGSPMGDVSWEVAKLSVTERELIAHSNRLANRVTLGHTGAGILDAEKALSSLVLRGLVERTSRGAILTGRGLMIREWLDARAGTRVRAAPERR